MFTSTIVRSLNRLHHNDGASIRQPVSLPIKRKCEKRAPSQSPATRKPTRTILSEPTQKCLNYAKEKQINLEREIKILENCTHPADLLRLKTMMQHFRQNKSRIYRLERDMARHQNYESRYNATRETLTTLEQKLLGRTLTSDIVDPLKETVHRNQCLNCGAKASMRINTAKSTQQCIKCFREEHCHDVVSTDGDRPMTSKANHYYPENQWLNSLNYAQGMRCGVVPPEIIHKVNEILDTEYEIRPSDRKNVPHQLIDDILKKMKYKKRSKQKVLIWCIITGRSPVRMTIQEFTEADRYAQVYFRLVRDVIKELNLSHRLNRKNLLSYDFLAYKILELLSMNEPRYKRHMDFYKLLQGDDKIYVQDLIWQRVCSKAGWDFYPTA